MLVARLSSGRLRSTRLSLPSCGEKVGGRCVLRALLGEGAFGRVFAAEDEETGQQVALKVVGLATLPARVRRARAASVGRDCPSERGAAERARRGGGRGRAVPLVHHAAVQGLGLGGAVEGSGQLVARSRARAVYAHRGGRVRDAQPRSPASGHQARQHLFGDHGRRGRASSRCCSTWAAPRASTRAVRWSRPFPSLRPSKPRR